MTFWCSVRIFGNDPQSTIINHPSNPRFPAKHQQGICTSAPRASSSLVALRVTLASQAASALAPVRARVLVIFSRDCGTNLFFLLGVIQLSVTIPIYSIIMYYIYNYIYIYPFIILYYILNPWVDSRENTSEFVLLPSYYRPNCQSQVPPPDHTRPPVFQTCRLAKCAHIHLD